MSTITTSRRNFLLGASSLAATTLTTGTQSSGLATADSGMHQGLILARAEYLRGNHFAEIFKDAGLRVIYLGNDPVRQWRDEIEQTFSANAYNLFGLTSWSDLILLRGLCAEHQRHLLDVQTHILKKADSRHDLETRGQQLIENYIHKATTTDVASVEPTLFHSHQQAYSWVIG